MQIKAIVLLVILLTAAACAPAPTPTPLPTADAGATATAAAASAQAQQTEVARAVAAALTAAAPTATSTLTQTPTPTVTRTPTATPTATPVPPTDTLVPPTNTPTRRPPTATPTLVPTAIPVGMNTKAIVQDHWEIAVVGMHRDKTVYFYSQALSAFGTWATFMVRIRNLQSGTDYYGRNYGWIATTNAGQVFKRDQRFSADFSAAYMYCGCGTTWSDIQPGAETVIVVAFDVPETTQRIKLRSVTWLGEIRTEKPFVEFTVDEFDKVPAFKPNN